MIRRRIRYALPYVLPFLGFRLLALYDVLVLGLLALVWGRPYVGTRSGKHVHLLAPRAQDLKVRDIAHALSHTERYGGHVRHSYTVAQHCYHVARACTFPREAALHDGPEAYLGDVVQPLKRLLRPIYGPIERRFDRAFGARFELTPQPHYASWEEFRLACTVWDAVKRADENCYLWEATHLIQACLPPDWKGRVPPRPPPAWMPHAAKAHFHQLLEDLEIT